MVYSKEFEAFMAAERIIDMVRSAGFDITDPYSILNADYSMFPYDMEYSNGASRLVIWDNDYCDYVIKIALDQKFEKFNQHEVEVYREAVKEGFADNFAWCTCYQEPMICDDWYVPGIYVMEYMDCNEDAVSDVTWTHGFEEFCYQRGLDSSDCTSVDKYNDWNEGESEEMVLDYMESLMSPEYRRAFEVFMCKWWITDIHEQNVALKPDGNIVIVDYAGWGWQ